MKKPNRLANELSPYLLQHKENPVDWYPWGEEAFERAKREDKPVFLSIGYSSCHWCHVMEHESFEDEEVAKLLNEGFVSVKVDREERPDIDDVYMRVTQMLTGGGGWPMTVFLTPEKRPFFAGTYFPKEARLGQPSFLRILEEIRKAWTARREEVEKSAAEIARAVAQSAEGVAPPPPGVLLDASLVRIVAAAYERRYDARFGGFGGAPKFPPHHVLRLFIAERDRAGRAAFEMALATLDKMAAGGICDQVGGGFHRYSVDEEWLVPHFEKMLYDNALLARAYAMAFEATGKPHYRRVAEGIFAFIAREMTDPSGGFYSALDADSENEEGKCYLWRPSEIEAVLGKKEAAEFCRYYDISEEGNWEGKSIPRIRGGPLEAAGRFDEARAKLLEVRRKRVLPALDDKVLAGWNGLMIGAYAWGYKVFGDERYRAAAEKGAQFILSNLRAKDGRLFRSWRRGRAGIAAYLEDYAFFADGLFDLYEATGEKRWLEAARELADRMIELFCDPVHGGFFSTAIDHEQLLFREKDAFDGATPSPNGVAARVLARLAKAGLDPRYGREADRTIEAFSGMLPRAAIGVITLIEALAIRGEVRPTPGGASASLGSVSATAQVARPIAPGGEGELVVRIAIAPGLHINARDPGLGYLVPIEVKPLDTDLPVRFGEARYPPAKEWRAPFAGRPIFVYEGAIEVKIPLFIAPEAAPQKGRLRVSVQWQACGEKECLAPAKRTLEVPIEIETMK